MRKSLPDMLGDMAVAAWETICHRVALGMSGQLTLEECERMVSEKLAALQESSLAAASLQPVEDVIAPFHDKALANAARLRASAEGLD